MDTLYRERGPADDLFERDGPNHGHYSPLETLVRQTSLKGGWRVKGAQNMRAEEHPPSSMASTPVRLLGRSQVEVASASTTQQVTQREKRSEQHLSPGPEQSFSGSYPPASPLLHAQFRQSTQTTNSFGDSRNSTLTTTVDQSFATTDRSSHPVLPSRLTIIDDDTIDRVRADQWDSGSDTDSPTEERQNILPPSFRFQDSGTDMSGGRPLSDRSMVIPPSVRGLSLRNKGGVDSPTIPNSPAGMSFYSESAYSAASSSKLPTPAAPSFNQTRSIPTSPAPPPPRPVSEASEDSLYDTTASYYDATGPLDDEDEEEDAVDFASALERGTTNNWKSRQSDLDPFAFRQYEGKSAPSAIPQPANQPQRRQSPPLPRDEDVPRHDPSPSAAGSSSAPNIVVTSATSLIPPPRPPSNSLSDHSSTPSRSGSPIVSSYPYLPAISPGIPTSQSMPVALPSSSPAPVAPASPNTMESANRAPSLVSAKVGGRFNFSRPMRMIPTSPSEPVSSHYIDKGWSSIAEASDSQITSELDAIPADNLPIKRPTLAQMNAGEQPQQQQQASPAPSPSPTSARAPPLNKGLLAPHLRSDTPNFRDSGISSESLYAIEQRFPAPPVVANQFSAVNSFTALASITAEEDDDDDAGGLYDGIERRSPVTPVTPVTPDAFIPAGPSGFASDYQPQASPMIPTPRTEPQERFVSPRPAPSPPSSSDHHTPYAPPQITTVLYSAPGGAKSQPQFSSPRSEERLGPGSNGKGYGSLTPRTRGGQPSQDRDLLQPFQPGLSPNPSRSPPSPGYGSRQVSGAESIPNGGRGDGSGSPHSLYSNYSYYGVPESPSATSPARTMQNSPSDGQFPFPGPPGGSRRPSARSGPPSPMNPHSGRPTPQAMLSPAQLTPDGLYQPQYTSEAPQSRSLFGRKKSRTSSSSSPQPAFANSTFAQNQNRGLMPQASSAEEYLQMGITHHEQDQLALSAHCFEQAATLNGGCGFGMLMWGLTLRHGWGVKRDEKAGFSWMRQAADAAVGNLEAAIEGAEADAVRIELVLAIFEVGQCYSKGWGVKEDKKMAFSYFQVAARLGDSDAQQELGFCFMNGRGTKKDKKQAAKWYRAAAAQGASTVGLQWIFKDKYD